MVYTEDEIFERLKKILKICMPEADIASVTRDTVINRDLGIDSMNFIMIMAKVEGAFDITVPDELWSRLSTAQDVIDIVKKLTDEKAEAGA
ncbi:MAG: acyl carrier protein [Lachnospiraceae bacterium]|jgi:acyl carrier protein|nr:acyl carrier protein [Lachnospiraceae bacterium]MCH4032248.1 acyl carrier protein [Lachnospiraceae bacterium]MCH4108874.1 acyl carrier protein [Lachnospiraceae bacterium]MCI1303140.1 acyl carrier protein [Lachnospiraceae bacterium]MCI1332673.1 acyl carrier protein [Lachnospiraceae bacterium]